MIVPVGIAFVAAAPAHACVGFEPPLADGPVTVRGNRALPLKAELLDQDDFPLTDADLSAAPVVQVNYHSDVDELPEDSQRPGAMGRPGHQRQPVRLRRPEMAVQPEGRELHGAGHLRDQHNLGRWGRIPGGPDLRDPVRRQSVTLAGLLRTAA